jgi:hypothetical protein
MHAYLHFCGPGACQSNMSRKYIYIYAEDERDLNELPAIILKSSVVFTSNVLKSSNILFIYVSMFKSYHTMDSYNIEQSNV